MESQNIFEKGVGIRGVMIKGIIRLGKRDINNNQFNKPRPMLVKLDSEEQKWEILKNAKNLARAAEEMKRCIIAPDLTKKEREQDTILRNELKERRNNGDNTWIIRRGQLVKKNF